jgi:hypothetical protein
LAEILRGDPPGGTDPTGSRRSERPAFRWAIAAIVVVCVGLEVLVVAVVPIFVTTDGAAHVGGAAALAQLLTRANNPVGRYLDVSWLPATNLVPELPMAVLAGLFGAQAAEKVVLAAFIVLLPVALYYALTSVRRDAGWLAVLALPLTFSLLLQLGFYSFCYAIVAFLLVAGYHRRHRGRLGARETTVLSIGLTVTYAAHAFVFALALLLIAVLESWGWLVEKSVPVSALARRAARLLLAAAPPLILGGLDIVGHGGSPHAAGPGLLTVQVEALVETVTLVLPIVSFDQREAAFAILLAVVLALLAWTVIRARRGRFSRTQDDGYLVFVGIVLVGVTFISDSATLWAGGPGAFVTSRLSLAAALGFILWLAGHPFGPWARLTTTVVALVALSGLLAVRMPWYLRLSDDATAFASLAACVAPGSTVAQVNLSRVVLPSQRTDQIGNEAGRIAALTGGLDLGDAELGDQVHPLRYHASLDPYRYLRRPGGLPATVDPVIDPLAYEAATGGRLDYVLVFGRQHASPTVLASREWLRLAVELAEQYRLVATGDGGLIEVYELRASPDAVAGAAPWAPASDCLPVGAS